MFKASFKELDELVLVWRSQVIFGMEELVYFKSLAAQNLLLSTDEQVIHKLQRISMLLEKKLNEANTLLGRIDMHTVYLEELMEDTFTANEEDFRINNSQLEDKVCRFLITLDKLKTEIFLVFDFQSMSKAK